MAKAAYFTWANSLSDLLTALPGGGLENQQSKCGKYFFEWTGNRLRQIKVHPRQTHRPAVNFYRNEIKSFVQK